MTKLRKEWKVKEKLISEIKNRLEGAQDQIMATCFLREIKEGKWGKNKTQRNEER